MTYKFVNDGRDILGELVHGQQPQPTQRLLAGRFQSAEQLEEAYMALERQSDELDETLRAQNMNEIFWGGK